MTNHWISPNIGIVVLTVSLFSYSIFSGLVTTTSPSSFPWNSALAQVDGNDTQDQSQLPGQDGEPPTQPPTNDTGGVEPEPLTAVAQWDSTDGNTAPATFLFEADAEGGTEPYTFHWDFGDGQQATGQFIHHTYENPGTYTATMTVTDATDQTASDSTQVTVQPAPTNDTGCQFEITTDEETYDSEDIVTITVTNNGNESLEFPNSVLGLVIENLGIGDVFPLVSAEVITTLEPGESRTFEFTYEELVNEIGNGTIEARVSTTDGCSASATFTLTDDTGEPPIPGGNRSEVSNRISVQIQPPGCTSISDAEHWNKIVFRITSDPTGRIDSSLINTELEVLERVNDGAVLNLKDIVRYSIVNEPGTLLPQLTFEEADQLEIEILDVEYALVCFTP